LPSGDRIDPHTNHPPGRLPEDNNDNFRRESNMKGSSISLIAAWAVIAFTLPSMAQGVDPEFAGSDKCANCHKAAFDSWKQTYHSKMVLTRQEGLLKEAGDNWTSDGKNPGPAKGNIDGQAYKLEDVIFVIGTKWKQRYLVKNPATGNHQFLDKQWNRFAKQWEGYGQKNDWDTQCATCHTTPPTQRP
jgi:cytochrome c553